MTDEEQNYMALEGIHTWAAAVIAQVEAMETAIQQYSDPELFIDARRRFERSRLFFLLSTNRLMEYIDWATGLNFLDAAVFGEVLALRGSVKFLRNKNEHVVEYFSGKKSVPNGWMHSSVDGNADASATSGSMIGGRLDWKEIHAACLRLISALPNLYSPQP